MNVDYKDLRDKLNVKCERKRKIEEASKVFGLRKWRGIVIRLTEMEEREVWGIGRIKNYVLDKFELPIK